MVHGAKQNKQDTFEWCGVKSCTSLADFQSTRSLNMKKNAQRAPLLSKV
ncbi:hypothetical protein [Bacillus thuringiensis]|nr:hypothetical protein [Bacillus thuringiensis]